MSVKHSNKKSEEVFIMMYIDAIFKNETGHVQFLHSRGKGDKYFNRQLRFLEIDGYQLVKGYLTTNEVLSLKAELKFSIYCLRNQKYLRGIALKKTIDRIGLLTEKLIDKGVDVTNEVALQCCDLREQWVREKKTGV